MADLDSIIISPYAWHRPAAEQLPSKRSARRALSVISLCRPRLHHFDPLNLLAVRFPTPYALYHYIEGTDSATDTERAARTPVLFVPGSAGSFKQVRDGSRCRPRGRAHACGRSQQIEDALVPAVLLLSQLRRRAPRSRPQVRSAASVATNLHMEAARHAPEGSAAPQGLEWFAADFGEESGAFEGAWAGARGRRRPPVPRILTTTGRATRAAAATFSHPWLSAP